MSESPISPVKSVLYKPEYKRLYMTGSAQATLNTKKIVVAVLFLRCFHIQTEDGQTMDCVRGCRF
jgi:hypothetical protein